LLTIPFPVFSRDDEFPERFIDFMALSAELRQIVYQFIFKRAARFEPRNPSELPFNGDYTNRFSTILQTSNDICREARPILYSENAFTVRARKDCLTPFTSSPSGNASDTLFRLKDLTVHLVKFSGLKKDHLENPLQPGTRHLYT
jgi:hypothetical protein